MLDTELTRHRAGGDVIGGRVPTAGLDRDMQVGTLIVTALTRWGLLELLEEITAAVYHMLEEQRPSTRVSIRLLITTEALRVDVGHEWMLVPLNASVAA